MIARIKNLAHLTVQILITSFLKVNKYIALIMLDWGFFCEGSYVRCQPELVECGLN